MTNITLPSESDLRLAFIESMTSLVDSIRKDAVRIADDKFSDDDTDTMPANAATLAFIISTLTNIDTETPCLDAMNAALIAHDADDNTSIIFDMLTADGLGESLSTLIDPLFDL